MDFLIDESLIIECNGSSHYYLNKLKYIDIKRTEYLIYKGYTVKTIDIYVWK